MMRIVTPTLLLLLTLSALPAPAAASDSFACDLNALLCCRSIAGGINWCQPAPCDNHALARTFVCGYGDACHPTGSTDVCDLPDVDACAVNVGTIWRDCQPNVPIGPCDLRVGPVQECSVVCHSSGGILDCLPSVCRRVGDEYVCLTSGAGEAPKDADGPLAVSFANGAAPMSNCYPEVLDRVCDVTGCYDGPLRNTPVCRPIPDPCDQSVGPVHDCGVDLPDPCVYNVGTVWYDCQLHLPPVETCRIVLGTNTCDPDLCRLRVGPLQECSIVCHSNSPWGCLPPVVCNVGEAICDGFSSPPAPREPAGVAKLAVLPEPEPPQPRSVCYPGTGVQYLVCRLTHCQYNPVVALTPACEGGLDPCEVNVGNVWRDCTLNLPTVDPCDVGNVNPCDFDVCRLDIGPLQECGLACHTNNPLDCTGLCRPGAPRNPCDPCTLVEQCRFRDAEVPLGRGLVAHRTPTVETPTLLP